MLLDTLLAVRRRSEALIAPLEPEDLMLQGMADASPPKWHLGHTNWFFDTFVLQAELHQGINPFGLVLQQCFQTGIHPLAPGQHRTDGRG